MIFVSLCFSVLYFSWDSSVGIGSRLRAGRLGFDSRQGIGIFLFTTASRPDLGPTQPAIQWLPRARSLGVTWPGREADHLSHIPPRLRMRGAIPPLPYTSSWRGAYLKYRILLPLPYLQLCKVTGN
jgi:hypothetical protein